MKKYKKPEVKAEILTDINEPVYMDCSGRSMFDFSDGSGWTHQIPEQGRWNSVEQINGEYKGPSKTGKPIEIFAYVTFNTPVNVDTEHGSWEWWNTWGPVEGGDPSGSYTIVGRRVFNNGINHGENIGLGALYVVAEDGVTNPALTGVVVTWGFNGTTFCK